MQFKQVFECRVSVRILYNLYNLYHLDNLYNLYNLAD